MLNGSETSNLCRIIPFLMKRIHPYNGFFVSNSGNQKQNNERTRGLPSTTSDKSKMT